MDAGDLTRIELARQPLAKFPKIIVHAWCKKCPHGRIPLRQLSEAELEFSIEATGFTIGEIDLRIEGLEETSANSEDDAPTPNAFLADVTQPLKMARSLRPFGQRREMT